MNTSVPAGSRIEVTQALEFRIEQLERVPQQNSPLRD
jgi:hypothetical protein